ncbi:hypothetical protein [Mycolicibacterium llatzerense]|uniref:hypothetical protein n=1 Tax=Mycolicibacterium llatzerense TaxID=280871 RepID=UPI000697388C|nr:hypothetical protein [Mycolicibacterium llatzerense]
MPQAPSRSGLTPAQAFERARAARSARKPSDLALGMAQRASLSIIGTRERAAAKMKSVLRSLLLPVDPYDGDQIREFTTAAARQLGAAQKATAIAAAAGQVQMLSTMGVQVKARPSAPIDVRAPRVTFTATGVDLEPVGVAVHYADQDPVHLSAADMTTVEVLNRPLRKMRYLESQGATREQALRAGIVRLDSTIDANLMLSQRLAEAEVINAAANLDGSPVVGMRRIIHPELSLTGTCGLCIAASDRLYTVRELLPMHRLCKCTSAAVTEEFDPADELNAVDLRRLYRDAGGTSRAHLKRTRYKEDEHGELGPTLKPERTYKPRGKASAAGEAGGTGSVLDETPAEIAHRQLPLFEANLEKLRADGRPEDSAQVKYHKEQIAKYRERIAAEAASSDEGTLSSGGAQPVQSMKTVQSKPETAPGAQPPKPPTPPVPPRQNGGVGDSGDGDFKDHPDLSEEDRAEARAAAQAKRAAAEAAEPEVSATLSAAVAANGGQLDRFDSRLKEESSLYRKIQDIIADNDVDADAASTWIRDSLRYTAVVEERGYWGAGNRIGAALEEAGYRRAKVTLGWNREGYRGRNDTFVTPEGQEFEVQIHTAASLHAAEVTHGLYEEERLPTTSAERKAQLSAEQYAIFASVPAPDDVVWLD